MFYLTILLILVLILILPKLITKTKYKNIEKLLAYECGFDAYSINNYKFYIKYFIIAIIFLIFDLETIIIYIFTINIYNINLYLYNIYYIIILIIYLGLVYEKNKNVI